jgi:hypothetical protein
MTLFIFSQGAAPALLLEDPYRECVQQEMIRVGGGGPFAFRAPTPIPKVPNKPHHKLPAHLRYYIENMKAQHPPLPLPWEGGGGT